jgi:hypothetical protein
MGSSRPKVQGRGGLDVLFQRVSVSIFLPQMNAINGTRSVIKSTIIFNKIRGAFYLLGAVALSGREDKILGGYLFSRKY